MYVKFIKRAIADINGYMKRNMFKYSKSRIIVNLIMLLLISIWTVYAQRSETTSNKYLRPSMTCIYINRGEPLSIAVIEQMAANGISAKYNDNHVSRNVIAIPRGEPISETKLTNLLQTQITKEIAKIWFPFDKENNEYSRKVMYDRGLDAATYQDERTAGATFRQNAWLQDAGKWLINRSYIVVYDIHNIRQTKDRAAKGYMADCDVYLYKLDWSEQHYATLFTVPNNSNPDYINQITLPIQHLASLVGKSLLRNISVSEPENWNDDLVLKHFAQEIANNAEIYMSQVNADFQVQTPIYSTSPIKAQIGIKEGLKVDQRYYVYELSQSASGETKWKRKGVIRVRKVADNRNNNTLTSDFYQVTGSKLKAGMNLVQTSNAGIGISIYGASTEINALLEMNMSLWAGKHGLGSTNFPYGTKVFIKYTLPFNKMTTDIVHVDGDIEKVRSLGILGGGLSKDLCFAKFLSLTPYVGFTGMLAFEKLQPALTQINKMRIGVEAGNNLSVALSPVVSIIGNANFNSVKKSWYSENYTFSGGLRIQFN